jgi:serine phosphatase RsbU (regulator of sigma subunit)
VKASLSLTRLIRTTVIAAAVVVLILTAADSELITIPEKRLEDIWCRLEPSEFGDDRVVVVEIDDGTLEYYFPEIPIPRGQIALLIADLAGSEIGTRVVAVDLYFEGPDRADPSDDTLLAEITRLHSDAVVGALFFSDLWEEGGADTSKWDNPLQAFSYDVPGLSIPVAGDTKLPPSLLLRNAAAYGHINVDKDETGVLRKLPLFVDYGGAVVGSFALEVLRTYAGVQRPDVTHANGAIHLGPYRIPVSRSGTVRVRYFGSHESYQKLSMLDLLESLEDGSVSDEILEDRIVLVGIASKTYYPKEFSYTPYGDERPNVYLHADLISNVLAGRYLVDADRWLLPVMAALLGLVYCMVHFLRSRLLRLLVSLLAILAVILIDLTLFRNGISMQVVPLVLVGIPLTVYTYFVSFWEQVDIIRVQEQETLSLRKKEASLVAIEQEIKVARAIQKHLLPQTMPEIDGYDIYGANSAAKGVSGDFFDFMSLGHDQWAVMVADVSGKGISASLLMAASQAVLKSESMKRISSECHASDIIAQANSLINSITDPSRFVTLFYLVLDANTGRMECVNAGHNPPLIAEPDGQTRYMQPGDVVLGALPGLKYADQVVTLQPGQKLVIYTDGVVEAENCKEEQFGEERLAALAAGNSALSARQLVEAIIEDVDRFADGAKQSDDITVVVLGRET